MRLGLIGRGAHLGLAVLLAKELMMGFSRITHLASTVNFLINWSISELNTQVNPTTCLGDTDCWIQQVTAPSLVVTCWNQQSVCILHSSRTGKIHTDC